MRILQRIFFEVSLVFNIRFLSVNHSRLYNQSLFKMVTFYSLYRKLFRITSYFFYNSNYIKSITACQPDTSDIKRKLDLQWQSKALPSKATRDMFAQILFETTHHSYRTLQAIMIFSSLKYNCVLYFMIVIQDSNLWCIGT